MTDDLRAAFDHPLARAEAAGVPLDRISLRDHVVSAEIGAFEQERGLTQRLRFQIVVEVRPLGDAADDVDRILSYDRLTEAVATELAAERRVPILIHGGRGLPPIADHLHRLAETYPDAQLIIAHGGIADMAALAAKNGIEPHAGHGLTYDNVQPIAAIPQLAELNIGHYLVGEAVFVGLEAAVRRMRELMDDAR